MEFEYTLTCQHCGSTFVSKQQSSRYCSNKCRCADRYQRQRELARQEEGDKANERKRQDLIAKEYLSITQAAQLLGVSRPTIYKRIDSGEIHVVRLGKLASGGDTFLTWDNLPCFSFFRGPVSHIRPDGDPDWESDFYILKNTLCASALSENLFHDNAGDLAFLESAPGRQAIIDLHVRGIISYVNG